VPVAPVEPLIVPATVIWIRAPAFQLAAGPVSKASVVPVAPIVTPLWICTSKNSGARRRLPTSVDRTTLFTFAE
jgi:hypothetical protein